MKKNDDAYERKLLSTFINVLISAFKWICLALCVITAGLTIGLLVMSLLKGEDLANTILAKMFSLLTSYTEVETLGLIISVGKIKVMVAGIGYGFAVSLTYGLIYALAVKFKILFKSIINGNMFTKENVKMINDAFPYTLIVAFASPVIMYCIISATGIFDYNEIKVIGITFIVATYILKLIFEKGLELEKKVNKYDKELSDFKAQEGENKLDTLKKEIASKEVKQVTKKPTKKVVPSKKTTKAKKETTKKTTKRTTKSV